jgi:hypothetical protein
VRAIDWYVTAVVIQPTTQAYWLLGFQGTKYQGMQRNPGAETIEEELLTALLKVDQAVSCIPSDGSLWSILGGCYRSVAL